MVREAAEHEMTDRERITALERTLESLSQDSEVAHVLLGLSGALAEVRTVTETLEKGVRIARELFGAERCFAASWDGAAERFQVLTHFGFNPDAVGTLAELAAREEGGLPLLLDSLQLRQPILVDDVESDDRVPVDEARRRELRGYIVIPLLRWGQDFGGIGIEFAEVQSFRPKQVALARGIARQMSVALANARRFNLMQALRGIGLRMGSPLRLSAVTREAAAGAVELLGGDAALLYFWDGSTGDLVAAGGSGAEHDLYEALGRLSRDDETWSVLFEGRTSTIHDLREHLGTDGGPLSAVATTIPGAEAAPLGALVVTFDRRFTLGPDEAEALNVMVVQAASAIENARRFERQRRVARSLQAGLLRTDLPAGRTFELHATYEPASSEADVGGDFYDAFDLSDGSIAIVVGDVSGKGAEAAAHTAMAKYMLRAFSMRNPSPGSVLFHLNNALCQGFAEDQFTTLFYGVYDPRIRTFIYANGGHPEPLLYRAAGDEVEVVQAEGGIVGAFENQRFAQATLDLRPGDVLVSYTDGLIEARDDEGELYGRERVSASLERNAQTPAGELTRALYREARDFGTVTDDTVIFSLVLKRADP
ncbi:MAG: SpoIIE family protein phosphatase [Actinomycetota bacterium]|nr:SpoIIE family protein phosphatase [Actinomycetota bacterium]